MGFKVSNKVARGLRPIYDFRITSLAICSALYFSLLEISIGESNYTWKDIHERHDCLQCAMLYEVIPQMALWPADWRHISALASYT